MVRICGHGAFGGGKDERCVGKGFKGVGDGDEAARSGERDASRERGAVVRVRT